MNEPGLETSQPARQPTTGFATSGSGDVAGVESPDREAASHIRAGTDSALAMKRRFSSWLDLMNAQLRQTYLETTRALVAAVEAKDYFTERHSLRVRRYSGRIAIRMGLPAEDIATLETAAMLHDIGKIGVPDAILNKPGPLLDAEFAVVRRHPGIGVEILGHTTFLNNELPLILHHHERYDGSGYPARLTGEQIPLGARILNVADSLDAMFSKRTYKDPLSVQQVRMELVRCKGHQFDPGVVDATLAWLDTGDYCDDMAS